MYSAFIAFQSGFFVRAIVGHPLHVCFSGEMCGISGPQCWAHVPASCRLLPWFVFALFGLTLLIPLLCLFPADSALFVYLPEEVVPVIAHCLFPLCKPVAPPLPGPWLSPVFLLVRP